MTSPLVRNAADKQQVEEGKRKVRDRAKRLTDDYKAVLATREGRRVFWHLLGSWGLYESPEGINERETYRKIGRGDAARELLKDINDADPQAFIRMQQEIAQEAKKDG